MLGGVPDVDGGVDVVFGFVGGVDCVGQFALASITDPSGHVFVVGVVDGGTDVNGGGVGVIPCSFASCISQSLVLRFLSGSVMALLSARSHLNICGSHFPVTGSYTCPG